MTDDTSRLELGTIVGVTTGTAEYGNRGVQPLISVTVHGSVIPDETSHDYVQAVVESAIGILDPDGQFREEARQKARRRADGSFYGWHIDRVRYTLVPA